MKREPEKRDGGIELVERRLSTTEMLERAIDGDLSDDDVYQAASAVVDAALWSGVGGLARSDHPGMGLFMREPRTPERRDKLIRSLVTHPERTRRLFRS